MPRQTKVTEPGQYNEVNENDALKMGKPIKAEGDGKYVMRRAASNVLPEDIVWRKKQGFSA